MSQPLKVAKPELDEGTPTCVTEGCGKERQWKGLCRSCYGQARKLIDDKEVSGWDELENMGLIIQDDKPFKAAFKRKLKEKQQTMSPYLGLPQDTAQLKVEPNNNGGQQQDKADDN